MKNIISAIVSSVKKAVMRYNAICRMQTRLMVDAACRGDWAALCGCSDNSTVLCGMY